MAYTTIDDPTIYFNTKLYTGNGSTQSITGLNFQPDFVWIKDRSASNNHGLSDAVRGVTKRLVSNNSDAESTQSGGTTSFDRDGFSLGTFVYANTSGNNYASWNWKANGAGSANTDGSTNSTVSANTTAGFSIVSYTGTGANATVGHGLGVLPSMIIIKSRSKTGQNWITWHKAFTGNNEYVELNTTDAKDTYDMIDNTSNTTSVFAISGDGNVNESGATYVAYAFAEKTGYSKFGSYVGNGNADGTFVYTGFKPAMIIKKPSSRIGDWQIEDNKRNTGNVVSNTLFPNGNSAENTGTSFDIDFLSNGFKVRATNTHTNESGSTYIYMAFAEAPLVGSNNVPCTAR